MKLLTDFLPEKTRSAARFVVVGALGTLVQYGLYCAFLELFNVLWGETVGLTTVAFGLGFCLEMMLNYLMTCFYTFGSKPSWKNCLGFFGARVPNYLIQNGLLWALLWCDSNGLFAMTEKIAGIWAIIVAGVVNYFMLTFVYKKKENDDENLQS